MDKKDRTRGKPTEAVTTLSSLADELTSAASAVRHGRLSTARKKVTSVYADLVCENAHVTRYVIESSDAGEEAWEEWGSDRDAARLLRIFVDAVNGEMIDDVNREWRLRELGEVADPVERCPKCDEIGYSDPAECPVCQGEVEVAHV